MLPLASRFQYRFGHFLHKQRDAIGALNDVLPDARREQLVADDAVDHGLDVALRQPIEGESGHVRSSDPGWIELWTERHNQQHTKVRSRSTIRPKSFQARGVGPMCILKDHQHRILA